MAQGTASHTAPGAWFNFMDAANLRFDEEGNPTHVLNLADDTWHEIEGHPVWEEGQGLSGEFCIPYEAGYYKRG